MGGITGGNAELSPIVKEVECIWIDFLRPRCRELIYIDHPFSYKKGDIRTCLRIYKNGKLVSEKFFPFSKKLPEIFFYLKDFLLNLFLVPFHGKFWFLLSTKVYCYKKIIKGDTNVHFRYYSANFLEQCRLYN